MSQLSVNTIQPRTGASVEIAGLNSPTHGGVPLAKTDEVILETGGTMTGPLMLSGNATLPLQAVPRSQVVGKEGGVENMVTNPLYVNQLVYPANPVGDEFKQVITRGYLQGVLANLPGFIHVPTYGPVGGSAGYATFPSGLIVQWVRWPVADVQAGLQQYSITLPVGFSSNCMFATVSTEVLPGSNNRFNASVIGRALNAVDVQVVEWNSEINPVTLLVLAIGV